MQTEKQRLDDLNSYQIMDTSQETELDELAEIASLICDAPISFITILDEDRQWFKAKKGIDLKETERKDSFCQHALHSPKEILVVNDTLLDNRFKNNSLVKGSPNIRFYAGAPLETPNGNVLGTLCVIDTKPREISANQQKALQMLAKKTMDFLTTRKLFLQQKEEIGTNAIRLKKLTDNVPGGIFQFKMSPGGKTKFEFMSKGITGIMSAIKLEQWKSLDTCSQMVHPDDFVKFKAQIIESFNTLSLLHMEFRIKVKNEDVWHMINGKPEKQSDGNVVWYGSLRNIDNRIEYQIAMEQIAFDISHILRRPVTSLLGLNALIDGEKNIKRSKLLEYVGYIKTVSLEMDAYTRNLNNVYQAKKKKITGHNDVFNN